MVDVGTAATYDWRPSNGDVKVLVISKRMCEIECTNKFILIFWEFTFLRLGVATAGVIFRNGLTVGYMGMNDRKHATAHREFFKRTGGGAMLSMKLAQKPCEILTCMPVIVGTKQTVGIGISWTCGEHGASYEWSLLIEIAPPKNKSFFAPDGMIYLSELASKSGGVSMLWHHRQWFTIIHPAGSATWGIPTIRDKTHCHNFSIPTWHTSGLHVFHSSRPP